MFSYEMQNNILREKIQMTISSRKNIFKNISKYHKLFNLEISKNHTTKYGNKSLRCLASHIWNSLPNQFKEFINDWFSMKCKCNLCSFLA